MSLLSHFIIGWKKYNRRKHDQEKKIKAVGTYRPISGEVHPVPTYSDEGIVKHNAAET